MQSQTAGLAEAAGLAAETRVLAPRGIWRHVAPTLWPWPLRAVDPAVLAPALPELIIGCGGKAAAVIDALHRHVRGVIIGHPRRRLRTGSTWWWPPGMTGSRDRNVISTRTAPHRVTAGAAGRGGGGLGAASGAAAAAADRPSILGGSNGRFRLDAAVGAALAAQLAETDAAATARASSSPPRAAPIRP